MSLPAIVTILGLFAAVIALAELARKTRVPYPTLMVVAGLIISLMPWLPNFTLSPDLVFLVFLPPILYAAAWTTWLHDFRRHALPISFLAVGLVVFTAIVVAEVCTMVIPGMRWWQGFLLGAIVSPPDAAAATAICQRLGVSRRIVTVLEGESLVNDASGLIAYRVALVAITQGSFSPAETAWSFLIAAGGGVCVGLVAGMVFAKLHKHIRDPIVTAAISLLAPYAAYIPAESLGVSGVLATVAAGLYVSRRSPEIFGPLARIQITHVWDLVLLLVNGVVFVLIGLQLDDVLLAVKNEYTFTQLAVYAVAVSGAVIAVRLLWVFPIGHGLRLVLKPWRRLPVPGWQQLTVVGWTGMRGIVSLAAAVALPMTVAADDRTSVPFEFRNLIVLLTFSVIFATLVLQSLTLGPLIRFLGESVRDGVAHEELVARMMIASAALSKLDQYPSEGPEGGVITRVRAKYLERLEAAARTARGDEGGDADVSGIEAGLHREAIDEERAALVRLRNAGEISEEVFRTLERELDFDEARLTGA